MLRAVCWASCLVCFCLFACASAPVASGVPLERGEVLLERGGELSLEARPAATTRIEGALLVAWAQAEVPAGSRLQAALAMVDGLARAELIKSALVLVTTSDEVTASAGPRGEEQSASTRSAELARGLFGKLPPAEHAWLRVRRDGRELLRVYARQSVEKSAVLAALPEGGR